MTIEEFQEDIKKKMASMANAVDRTIPVKVGVAAEKHVKENFRKSGFVNNGLQPWAPSARIGKAKGVAGKRKTLFGATNNLYDSNRHRVEPGMAIIYNDCHYAEVHNEGGDFSQSVKTHTRTRNGKSHNVRAFQRTITMPKRQFIGDSAELNRKVEKIIDNELAKILKNE